MKSYCKLLFFYLLLGVFPLHSEKVQPWTTPEKEEAVVTEAEKKTCAPLSEALYQLIEGISDETFDKAFFDKIVQKEEEKVTGEYTDHWENGQLKIKASFKEGKVDGHVHGWFSDGEEAFKAFFYENKKAGIHIAFHPCGAPRRCHVGIARLLSYNFEGQLHGEQRSKEYGGRLKTLITYKLGILDGSTSMYDLERRCVRDEFYEDGKLVPGKTTEKK